jgi:transposase
VTGLPIAWQVETARRNESLYVAPLIDAVRARGFRPETVAMDAGYDHARVYAECDERGCSAVIPLRKGQKERTLRIPRGSEEWSRVYRRRSSVEREFGRLKHHYGLAMLRVRGIERVRLHADLIALARLAAVLASARVAQTYAN